MSGRTGAKAATEGGRLAALLYAAFWAAADLAVRPLARRGNVRWKEKIGNYAAQGGTPRWWVHACSLGEVRVALQFMEKQRRRSPELCFTLSTVTPEGLAAARRGADGTRDKVVCFPFDSRGAMRRAFDRIRPSLVILTEVELWPNHLREAAARGIPVFVINGRLTASDERRYRLAGSFMRRTFSIPELVCARGPREAAIFERLGARKVVVTGDMKYDTLQPAGPSAKPRSERLLLGASTHQGEEEVLLRTAVKLRARFTDLRMAIVPRHPRRAASIAAMAERAGLRADISSQGGSEGDVAVVDEVGVLADYYCRATVCFVGKSLTSRGGQNFLEAAAAGCPIVTGPHLENFADAADLFLRQRAMVQVKNAAELDSVMAHLLGDPAERSTLRTRAEKVLRSQLGATERTVSLVASHARLPP